jgi:uncharacterized protein YpuA (DUF1002 family)
MLSPGKEMIVLKKAITIILIFCMALTLGAGALAAGPAEAGEARAVIGANLTDAQAAEVYSIFGVERGSVKELSITNDEERSYLDGLVDSALIGTNSISCVYLEILPEGSGLEIETKNLTWCTRDMFINALVTGGVEDARIIVAAPFEVSGTAALAGIYKAYEDITGQTLDVTAKLISTQELVITSELAEQVGSYDAVTIVNELKLILNETENMTDDELRAEIIAIAEEYGVSLTDSQIDQLITLCRAFEKMDVSELMDKVEYVQNTVKKLAEAQEKVSGITETVKTVVEHIAQFVTRVLDFFR